jgi:hypothetical protein
MSASDALLNLLVLSIAMTPALFFARWLIRRARPQDHSGADKIEAYRRLLIGGSIIALAVILFIYFLVSLIVAL